MNYKDDELKNGIGTKTDIGKIEPHLLCCEVMQHMDIVINNPMLSSYIELISAVKSLKDVSDIPYADTKRIFDLCCTIKFSILPYTLDDLEGELRVLKFGQYKYAADNWKKVEANIQNHHTGFRHILHFCNNKLTEDETGESSLHHAQCDLSFFATLMHIEHIHPYKGYEQWVEREKLLH